MEDVKDASAWGRRIFNDEEIDFLEGEELFKKFASEIEAGNENFCTDREKLQKLGLWDTIFNSGQAFRNISKTSYYIMKKLETC